MTPILIEGDNEQVLLRLAGTTVGAVTLAYLDPPFFTGRQHRTKSGEVAFDDRWDSLPDYLSTLTRCVLNVYPLLAQHGSIVLHVDSRVSHHVRMLCDKVFGAEAFASEVIWRYRRWPSKTPNFQRVHDVLLRYVRDPSVKPRFNQLYEPLAASTLAAWGTGKQRAVTDADGKRKRSSSTASESPGVPMGDVWDIGIIAPVAKERTGYPTQKPEALLERLILSLTNPGELVLDPYAGSGTTLAVASRLGRGSIGIDRSPVAIRTAAKRLEAIVTK